MNEYKAGFHNPAVIATHVLMWVFVIWMQFATGTAFTVSLVGWAGSFGLTTYFIIRDVMHFRRQDDEWWKR